MKTRLKSHVAKEAIFHQSLAKKMAEEQRHYLIALIDSGLRISSSTYYRWSNESTKNGNKASCQQDIARILIGAN